MPAFLTPDLWDDWLNPASLTTPGDADASRRHRVELVDELDASSTPARPRSLATMNTYLVDPRLNNARTVDRYDPTLLDPVGLTPPRRIPKVPENVSSPLLPGTDEPDTDRVPEEEGLLV